MSFWNFFRFRKRKQGRELSEAELLAREEREQMWDHSPAPWILLLTLIWVVCSVLLLLSFHQIRRSDSLVIGKPAAKDFYALSDFTIEDREGTQLRRKEALDNAEVSFSFLPDQTSEIERNLMDFFSSVETRSADLKQKRPYAELKDSLPSILAAKISPALLNELDRFYRDSDSMEKFNRSWRNMLNQGILPADLCSKLRMNQPVRTIDRYKRITAGKKAGQFCDSERAADLLAQNVFSGDQESSLYKEFRRILRLLLKSGNLVLDEKRTAETRERVEQDEKLKANPLSYNKGDILIKRGVIVTSALHEIAAASEKQQHLSLFAMGCRTVIALLLLVIIIFYLHILQPEILRHNRSSSLCGASILLGVLANYAVFTFFQQNFVSRISPEPALYLFLPIALTPVIVTVLVGFRAAVCCGTFVSIIAAMMLSPDRIGVLILRYGAISVSAATLVWHISNYRSFFIRTLFAAAAAGLLFHLDLLPPGKDTGFILLLLCGNAFCTTVAALVIIFAFELIFNVSTDMSLMVLCDYNHPLLERLKREAAGTLSHSMTVSTLAEDAAKAIRANPLKAKAGALFHDIGKLENAQFFSENNSSSGELHKMLSPRRSADIIRNHVTEGLRLAYQNRLCLLVREAIRTHHGDGIVYFFYAKAKEEAPKGTRVNVEDFSYTGTPPCSKELTIISLADVCEAASRSLTKPTPELIRSLVSELFLRRWGDRQLRNSELSLRELDLVRESFISTLNNIHHSRVAYTPEAIHEAAASQMEQSPSSRTAAR